MARKRIIIEDMVSGQQKTLECEGYLVCAFNDPVETDAAEERYRKADVLADNITAMNVAELMTIKDIPLGAAWEIMRKLKWNPRLMRKMRNSYKECD